MQEASVCESMFESHFFLHGWQEKKVTTQSTGRSLTLCLHFLRLRSVKLLGEMPSGNRRSGGARNDTERKRQTQLARRTKAKVGMCVDRRRKRRTQNLHTSCTWHWSMKSHYVTYCNGKVTVIKWYFVMCPTGHWSVAFLSFSVTRILWPFSLSLLALPRS